MIKKIYWATRILGYIACLGGIFMHLHQMQDATFAAGPWGLPLIGLGFIAFFVSYALRAWLRFAPRKPDPKVTP